MTGPTFAGAIADPVEAWLRCGPVSAWHTIVNGRFVVRDGSNVHRDLPHMLRAHAQHSRADPASRRLMPQVLQAFLVAFGVVFLAELPDKTMFATIVLSTRYRRPIAVVLGVTLAMAVHSVLAVVVGEALRRLPRTPTQLGVAVLFVVGGLLLLRNDADHDDEVDAVPVHSAWGVVGRSALIIGIAEFGDFTQLATIGIVADRGYAAAVAAGSLAAHIVVAVAAVLAGRWLERRLPVRTVQRAAGVLFMVIGVLTAVSAIRG